MLKVPCPATTTSVTNSTISTNMDAATTTNAPTTSQPPPYVPIDPVEACKTAVNLTDSWRKSHVSTSRSGGDNTHRNKQACDLGRNLQWFRFTGAAGCVNISPNLITYLCSDNTLFIYSSQLGRNFDLSNHFIVKSRCFREFVNAGQHWI